jgi:hypothetical protein
MSVLSNCFICSSFSTIRPTPRSIRSTMAAWTAMARASQSFVGLSSQVLPASGLGGSGDPGGRMPLSSIRRWRASRTASQPAL